MIAIDVGRKEKITKVFVLSVKRQTKKFRKAEFVCFVSFVIGTKKLTIKYIIDNLRNTMIRDVVVDWWIRCFCIGVDLGVNHVVLNIFCVGWVHQKVIEKTVNAVLINSS